MYTLVNLDCKEYDIGEYNNSYTFIDNIDDFITDVALKLVKPRCVITTEEQRSELLSKLGEHIFEELRLKDIDELVEEYDSQQPEKIKEKKSVFKKLTNLFSKSKKEPKEPEIFCLTNTPVLSIEEQRDRFILENRYLNQEQLDTLNKDYNYYISKNTYISYIHYCRNFYVFVRGQNNLEEVMTSPELIDSNEEICAKIMTNTESTQVISKPEILNNLTNLVKFNQELLRLDKNYEYFIYNITTQGSTKVIQVCKQCSKTVKFSSLNSLYPSARIEQIELADGVTEEIIGIIRQKLIS